MTFFASGPASYLLLQFYDSNNVLFGRHAMDNHENRLGIKVHYGHHCLWVLDCCCQYILGNGKWMKVCFLSKTSDKSLFLFFIYQSESPLLIKPYIDQLTNSELHAVMCSGFASVSGKLLLFISKFIVSVAVLNEFYD